MKKILRISSATTLVLFMLFLVCCDEQETPAEAPKSLEGQWKIIKVLRNDLDITTAMDFSKFKIRFSADNTYTLENYVPFLVKKEGRYALDDPQYPFKISLQEDGDATQLTTDLNYPIVNGKRQLSITFSPGCNANQYVYVFEKITE
jgi:hypothetical protein